MLPLPVGKKPSALRKFKMTLLIDTLRDRKYCVQLIAIRVDIQLGADGTPRCSENQRRNLLTTTAAMALNQPTPASFNFTIFLNYQDKPSLSTSGENTDACSPSIPDARGTQTRGP